MQITTGQVLKFSLLPGIIPRTHQLLTGGFGHISFYIAQIFYAVRLLPYSHPYLNPANLGRFGLGHVTMEAWQTISRGRWQIDQLLIFAIVMAGIAILFIQFCFLGVALFAQTAQAAGLPAGGFLTTADPVDDLAFILMDSVFGLPDFFGSCVALSQVCFAENPVPHPGMPYPMPYHEGLRIMFQIYSIGLLAIAMIIFSYFAVAILIETAEHGTPFGKRFNKTWAPIRMVVAIALLLPIANGLNAAQYLVMYAAKWGSGFATNGWTIFLAEATGAGSTIMGDPKTLVGIPNAPPVNTLLEFMTIVATCRAGEASGDHRREIMPYIIFPDQLGAGQRADVVGTSFADALERSNYGNIHYVFGATGTPESPNEYSRYPGGVRPVCGELVLKVTDVDDANSPGSRFVLQEYFRLINIIVMDVFYSGDWGAGYQQLRTIGYGFVRRNFPGDIRWDFDGISDNQDPNYPNATAMDLNGHREYYRTQVETILQEGINRQIASPIWGDMLDYGWAGAGIWYNMLARLNGTLLGAANALPEIRKYPEVMEYVAAQRAKNKESSSGPERHKPELSNGKAIVFDPAKQRLMAQTLYQAQYAWGGSYSSSPSGGDNPFLNSINAFLGTGALFELSKNVDTHPLASLVMIGKGLIESAIKNLASATGAGLAGGFANLFKELQPLGKTLTTASRFALQVSMLAITIGFMLFYVLPFLPFLYFFFAVGSWVKGIFEAMVGVPLWALAHIRIDGPGLSGSAALGGYMMLLEIFLRPILIIFGLLAAITIYGAQVRVLHEIWPLVVSNVSGNNATTAKTLAVGTTGSLTYMRSMADRLFYTVMYAIVVYMMGMASFKLIDMLPNQIMRWLGKDGGAFSDQEGNAPNDFMVKMNIGSGQMVEQVGRLGHGALDAADKVGKGR